jgi:glycosyltransferase involved in cell wall biosynthesis
MPAYNAAATVAASVLSVMNQSYGQWELVIVNDGSSDGTSLAVAPFLADARVHLIEQPNRGVAAARNEGIAHSRGEFVAFLDADDLWEAGKLSAQVARFRGAPPSLGLVHTRYSSFSVHPGSCRSKDDDPCFGPLAPARRILVYDFIATSTVMVRAELFHSVGLFDENLAGTEDWDLWIRLLARYDEAKLDQVLVKYRESPGGLSGNTSRHLAEEWKVIEKQVLANPGVPGRIRSKALFYHQIKELNYLLGKGAFAGALKKATASLLRNPCGFCDPGNYRDLFIIFWHRQVLKRW